jgi:hypothetical protein
LRPMKKSGITLLKTCASGRLGRTLDGSGGAAKCADEGSVIAAYGLDTMGEPTTAFGPTGKRTPLRISRRQRSISRPERRSASTGIARLARLAKPASSVRPSRCQNPGLAAPSREEGGSSTAKTLMRVFHNKLRSSRMCS